MGSSSNYSESWDLSSGQDMAHKLGQERSQLEAAQLASLYGGKIEDAMASANRIRELKKYLQAYGADPNSIEVIPQARIAQAQASFNDSDS
jgi:hypothetical protein